MPKYFVKAKPRSKHAKVEQIDETHFVIAVTEPPLEGKANAAIVRALAEHLGIAPSRLHLISNPIWKQKIFEVE